MTGWDTLGLRGSIGTEKYFIFLDLLTGRFVNLKVEIHQWIRGFEKF